MLKRTSSQHQIEKKIDFFFGVYVSGAGGVNVKFLVISFIFPSFPNIVRKQLSFLSPSRLQNKRMG